MRLACIIFSFTIVALTRPVDAQTNAFEVDVRGKITRDNSSFTVTSQSLLSTNSNLLVLVVNRTDRYVELCEVDPATTNIVRGIWLTYGFAALADGKFYGDLEAVGDAMDGSVEFPSGLPTFKGDLLIDGKLLAGNAGLVGKLTGYWKGSMFEPTNEPDALFKGTLKTTRRTPVPLNF